MPWPLGPVTFKEEAARARIGRSTLYRLTFGPGTALVIHGMKPRLGS